MNSSAMNSYIPQRITIVIFEVLENCDYLKYCFYDCFP